MTIHSEREQPTLEKEKRSPLPPTETFIVIPALEKENKAREDIRRKEETKPNDIDKLENIRQRIVHLQIPEAGISRTRVQRSIHDEAFGQLVDEFHQAKTEEKQMEAIRQIQELPEHLDFLTDMEMANRKYDGSTSAEPGGLIDLSQDTKEKTTEELSVVHAQKKKRWWTRISHPFRSSSI